MSERSPLTKAYIVLALALTAASFAAVLMRLSLDAGIPVMLVASGRLAVASIVLTPLVLRRYRAQLQRLTRQDILLSLFAGFWINAHFMLIATGFDLTSILVGQVIVNTSPLWVAFLEMAFFKTKLSRAVWFGMFIALMGGLVIGLGGAGDGNNISQHDALLGAAFALIGSIAGSCYFTIGRKVRAKVSLVPYVWMVYGSGAITGLIIMTLTHTPVTGYAPQGYLWLILLAFGPQLIGHSGMNYAVRYFPATIVSVATQVIVIPAAIIAFFIFAEVPGIFSIIGSLVIAIGVTVVIVGQRK